MTTLENLYYGNIAPHEFEVVRGSEYDITAKLVIRHEQELLTRGFSCFSITQKTNCPTVFVCAFQSYIVY